MGSFDHEAEVTYKRMVNESLFVIRFLPKDRISFFSGQYFSVVLPGNKPVPLSVASSQDSLELEFGITVKGASTQVIRDLSIGDFAILRGPFGKLSFLGHDKICFIAAGTGITPFMSMLRTINDRKLDIDAKLVYGIRSKDHLLWEDLLDAKNTYLAFSDDAPAGKHHGMIDSKFIGSNVPDIASRTCFVCGSNEFAHSMILALQSLGVPKENIFKESW